MIEDKMKPMDIFVMTNNLSEKFLEAISSGGINSIDAGISNEGRFFFEKQHNSKLPISVGFKMKDSLDVYKIILDKVIFMCDKVKDKNRHFNVYSSIFYFTIRPVFIDKCVDKYNDLRFYGKKSHEIEICTSEYTEREKKYLFEYKTGITFDDHRVSFVLFFALMIAFRVLNLIDLDMNKLHKIKEEVLNCGNLLNSQEILLKFLQNEACWVEENYEFSMKKISL
jgi:hypothetical protein